VFGRCLLCHADAGEGAQQAIQSIGICLTVFGQEPNATYVVSKCIGNAEACSRAKYTAAGLRHCHLYEPCIRRYIADATAELNHETPQIPGENIRGTAGDAGEGALLRNTMRGLVCGHFWIRRLLIIRLLQQAPMGGVSRVVRPPFPKTLRQFQTDFATEEACRQYLTACRWPDGFSCPRCGHERAYELVNQGRHQCTKCRHQVSLTSGTVLLRTKIPLTHWFWAAYLITTDKRGVSALLQQRQLGLSSYETAWMMLHKPRRGECGSGAPARRGRG